jgi:predicted dehydrogenase
VYLYGLRELAQTPFGNVEVAALCDLRRDHAELAAEEAEKLLGIRPPVFTDLEEMVRRTADLVYADVRLVEPVRKKPERINQTYPIYQARFQEMEETVPATAEDTSVALFRMESGMTVNWMVGLGGHGGYGRETIFGDRGVIEGFGTRGRRVRVKLAGQEEMDHEKVLEWVPGFPLEPLAEHLFPARRADHDPAVDWKLMALEHYELAEAILQGRAVEVDGTEGLKDVAAIYALFESARAGRPVKMSEVESGQVYAYQAEIDEALGIAN